MEGLRKLRNDSKVGCGGYACSKSIANHREGLEPLYKKKLVKKKDILTGKFKVYKFTTCRTGITVD